MNSHFFNKFQLLRGVCMGDACFHRFSRIGIGASLISAILGSSALFNSAWGLPTSLLAQVDPNTGFTGIQTPSTAITLNNGQVDIRFINETGSAIEYQVIGDTQYRSLAGRSEMTLENLRTPTTFTFRRADNGFLQVSLQPNSPSGTLVMRVRETPNFAIDRTSVYIDQQGKVYLN